MSGDTPRGFVQRDENSLYVLVQNSTAGLRRIEVLNKSNLSPRSLFYNNSSALSSTINSIAKDASGDLLISKTSSIEKITSSQIRITSGANPYVSNPQGLCATSTANITRTLALDNKAIVFAHAGASQNRIGIVSAAGYNAPADCIAALSAPAATASPTGLAYDRINHKLIVAYAGNTTATNVNSIYSYDLTETETSATLTNPQKIYDASLYPTTYNYLLYGISQIALDPASATLYVATSTNRTTTISGYAIEKLTYDASKIGTTNTAVLTRAGSEIFFPYSSDTKCISDLLLE